MKKVQESLCCIISDTKTIESVTQSEKEVDAMVGSALTNCIHRLCEPCFKVHDTVLEKEKIYTVKKSDLQAGKMVLAKLLPCTVGEVSSLFLPSDFNREKNDNFSAVWQITPSVMWHPGVFENVLLTSELQNKLERALQTIENCSMNIASHSVNALFESLKPKLDSDPEVQIGLLTLSEEILPLPIIDVIVPMEGSKQSEVIENIGTYAIARLLDHQHFGVQEITKNVCVDSLKQKDMIKNRMLLEGIVSNQCSCPLKFEMTSMKNFLPIEKGLVAAKNITLMKRHGVTTEDIMKYIGHQHNDIFEMNSVQMPFITVARRISSPLIVKKAIIQELNKNFDSSNCIGIKVLLDVIENVAYHVTNIEDYINPSDLLNDNIEKEKIVISQCTQIMSEAGGPEELVQMLSTEETAYHKELNNGVLDLVLKLQLPINNQKSIIFEPNMNCDIFNNVEGQSCLYNIAEQLSSSLFVKQIITSEAIRLCVLPSNPGFLALSKVLEKVHVQHENVQTLLAAEPFKPKTIERYLSSCQKITQILKFAQE